MNEPSEHRVNAKEIEELRRRVSELEEVVNMRTRMVEVLRESEERYRTIFETTAIAMIVIDEDLTVSMANTGLEELTGYTREELVGKKKWTEFIVEEDLGKIIEYHRLRRVNPHAAPQQYEFRMTDKMGNLRNIMVTVSFIPETSKSIASLSDITNRKKMEEQLRYLSTHDVLTGLYNRAYFEEEMIRLERGRQFPVSIIMVDVDGLKETNDSLGHAAGDTLLKRTAEVLKMVFRGEDVVARIGGDEFSILLPCTSPEAVENIAARIRIALMTHNGEVSDFPLSFSVGFSTGEQGSALAPVFNKADKKMYQDKVERFGSNERAPESVDH